MENGDESEAQSAQQVPSTTPTGMAPRVLGFEDAVFTAKTSEQFKGIFEGLGRSFDLRRLDGVTIAMDYRKALLELDRGYQTSFQLKPSEGHAVGIAMTPSVLRDGLLMSHILVDGGALFGMLRDEQAHDVIHVLAHECAHVEINAQFDTAFPYLLLRARHNVRNYHRWEIILGCWDEFAACMRSAKFGAGRADRYRETFMRALEETRDRANDSIKRYRLHSDIDTVIDEVCGAYRSLMKCSAYHLGNLTGLGIAWRDNLEASAVLDGHWFLPYFERLEKAVSAIDRERGKWTDKSSFEHLGDLCEELIVDGGLRFVERPDGNFRIDIPLTPETTPDV